LRTAYNSLKRNLPYLFAYLDHIHLTDIPNTTNWAEWFFSHFKYKVNLHRWLTIKRKLKLIQYLLLYSK
jgi:exosortase/archaeosortase